MSLSGTNKDWQKCLSKLPTLHSQCWTNNEGFVGIHMKISHALTLLLRLLHFLIFRRKKNALSTTLITDSKTIWVLVKIPWSNVIFASALIWSSMSIHQEEYLRL